jgi:uncharacterized membrane protein
MAVPRNLAALLAVAVCTPILRGQAQFFDLGPYPGSQASQVRSLSRDGLCVVGDSYEAVQGALRAFRWTATRGFEDLGLPENPFFDTFYPYAVSDDGRFATGSAVPGFGYGQAIRWHYPEGAVLLGEPMANDQWGTGISGDGSVVVGVTGNSGFRWSEDQGFQILDGTTSAVAVSRDGSTILCAGGGNGYIAMLWTAQADLEVIAPAFVPEAMSDDAQIVTGRTPDGQPLRWTRSGGVSAFHLPTGSFNYAFAGQMSADGTITTGIIGDNHRTYAAIWLDPASPPIKLETLLPTLGVDLTGWKLHYCSGISADGAVLAGTGWHDSMLHGWIVRLRPSCLNADYDHDGDSGTDADIEAFFRCLAGNCGVGCYSTDLDFDGDAATDADIEAFFRMLAGNDCG